MVIPDNIVFYISGNNIATWYYHVYGYLKSMFKMGKIE